MGLRSIFADSAEQGDLANDPAWGDVERLIQKRYIGHRSEKARREDMRQRRQLWECEGDEQALALVDSVFEDPAVIELRKQLVPYAKFDNALRRIVNERSRVYAKPAKSRRVTGKQDDERYQELQRLTNHDAAMRLANQLLSLQNDVLVLFRVRETPRGREPRIDVLGQDDFFALADPKDPTKWVGVIIDQVMDAPGVRPSDPHYLCWSDDESFYLDKHGRIKVETIQPNKIARIPGVLIHADYRANALLDAATGGDMVAAHLAAWLLNTLLLKESKSLSKQAAFVGETGNSPTGQAQESERDLILAEGVGVATIDRGVDLTRFRDASDHVIERAAANYNIPPSVLRHAGATSGYEIDLRRIPLEEIREDQIEIFRSAERRFADVQTAVLAQDMPTLEFSPQGWWIDFAEVKRPVPEREKYETRKLKRAMGHSDAIVEAREDNPDFTADMAAEWVADRVQTHQEFINVLRTGNVPADADAEDPGQTPEDNGAQAQEGSPLQ